MTRHFKKNESERGVVLIIVLIITAILSILVVDLIYFTQIDAEISPNTRDDIKARYIAKSGVNIVSGTLKVKPLEDLKELTNLLIGQTGEASGNSVINVPYLPVGDGTVSLSIDDERAKINLNALVNQSSDSVDKQVETELRELFRFVGIDSSESDLFIASLINWLDRPIEGKQNDENPTLSTVEAVIRKNSPGESSSVDIISWKEI